MPQPEPHGGRVWALGDATTVRAFALAGCRACPVDAQGAPEALARARAQGATLVIATEALAEALAGDAGRDLLPLVVFVPSAIGPRAAPTPGERLRRTVGRALGIPGPGPSAEAGRRGG